MKRITLALMILLALPLWGAEVFLPIAGGVGIFSSDARVFNPSFEDTITVQAYRLPVSNVDNSGATPVSFTIAPREMKIFDDVIVSLFQSSGMAGIRFTSDSDVGATARIFSVDGIGGTKGQFSVGVPVESALTKGVIIQLKSDNDFRTNLGFLNTHGTMDATVTLKLFDKTNNEVGTAEQTIKPFGVIEPTNVMALFPGVNADLSDFWVSFTSDKPLVAYGSVVDNLTTDQTFVPAFLDTGAMPPASTVKEFTVVAFQWDYTVTPTGGSPMGDSFTVKAGDEVRLLLTASDSGSGSGHGFSMSPFVSSKSLSVGSTQTVEFTASAAGTFTFFCTVQCGGGHSTMRGTMTVEP